MRHLASLQTVRFKPPSGQGNACILRLHLGVHREVQASCMSSTTALDRNPWRFEEPIQRGLLHRFCRCVIVGRRPVTDPDLDSLGLLGLLAALPSSCGR